MSEYELLSVCQPVSLSVRPSHLSVCLSVCLSVSLSACLCVWPPVSLLSGYLFLQARSLR
jgi:hypothetical protein